MRLIDADALLHEIGELKKSPWFNDDSYPGSYAVRKEAVEIIEDLCIKTAPTVDADIVCHGRWKVWYHGKEGGFSYTCSVCGIHADETSDYCPKCGARMDGNNE